MNRKPSINPANFQVRMTAYFLAVEPFNRQMEKLLRLGTLAVTPDGKIVRGYPPNVEKAMATIGELQRSVLREMFADVSEHRQPGDRELDHDVRQLHRQRLRPCLP